MWNCSSRQRSDENTTSKFFAGVSVKNIIIAAHWSSTVNLRALLQVVKKAPGAELEVVTKAGERHVFAYDKESRLWHVQYMPAFGGSYMDQRRSVAAVYKHIEAVETISIRDWRPHPVERED